MIGTHSRIKASQSVLKLTKSVMKKCQSVIDTSFLVLNRNGIGKKGEVFVKQASCF